MRCWRCSKTVGTVMKCSRCGRQVCAGCLLDSACIDCSIPMLCRSEGWETKYVEAAHHA